jgi:aminoglycoside phosphotransferase (APT) family kinase protein
MIDHEPLARSQDITASWLASVLRASGIAPLVEVLSLDVEVYRTKPSSTLYRLTPRYRNPGALPVSLLLKLGRPGVEIERAHRRRRREHAYYATIAAAMDEPLSPTAYSVACSADANHFHVLMDDLTGSHERPPRGLPPDPEQANRAIETYAAHHAAWWNHEDLRAILARSDEDYIDRQGASAHTATGKFLVEYGRYLDPSVKEKLRAAADATPSILAASVSGPVTLLHGDSHPWNVLTPRTSGGRTYLVDWEAWTAGNLATDLVNYIVMRFDPILRRRLQPTLLDRYHATLMSCGVTGYGRSDLETDYRRAIVRKMPSPVSRVLGGQEPALGWESLTRLALAWDDLGCADVLR